MKLWKTIPLSVATFAMASTAFAQGGDMPPGAQPGKCYAKCMIGERYDTVEEKVLVSEAKEQIRTIPGTYKTVTERVMVKPETQRLIAVPAQYGTVTERVLVEEASEQLMVVPATYKTETQQVVKREASTKLVGTPAQYKTVTDRIKVSDATTRWVKKRNVACLSENPDDCIIMCLETIPAQYRDVSRTVLASAASTQQVAIPAEYGTITKTVLATPATTKKVPIPAKYKDITRRVVKTPATTRVETIPAEYRDITRTVVDAAPRTEKSVIPAVYKTVTKRVLVQAGGYSEWREVACKSELTGNKISRIQQALNAKGYSVGAVDGILGKGTMNVLKRFQRENNLPIGNLDRQTLRALGVE